MQIWESDIFIDIVIGPLKSHVLEIRVWMIVTCVFMPLGKRVSLLFRFYSIVVTLLCSEDSLILSLGEKSRNCQLSANRETRRGHAQNDTARSESSNKWIPEGHVICIFYPISYGKRAWKIATGIWYIYIPLFHFIGVRSYPTPSISAAEVATRCGQKDFVGHLRRWISSAFAEFLGSFWL